MSFKKKFLCFLFIILIIGGSYMYFNSENDCISGADDFEVQTPFSEELFGSPCKDENMFIVKDMDGNTLNIEKLNESMFKNIVSSDFKDESYSLYSVSSFDDENNIYFYNVSGMVGLAEVVEVNNNKYKVLIGDFSGGNVFVSYVLEGNSYHLKLKEWRDYLIHFNEINNVKTLKL